MTFALILTVLRRRWKTITAFALLGLLGGAGLWGVTPTRYSATTSLVVSAGVSNPFTGTKEEVNIRTEQEILGSREVAQRASEALGMKLEPGSFLLSQVDIAAPSGSQILQVTVNAGSPGEARQAADALSEAYLAFRREGADTVVNGYLEKIDEQLGGLQAQQRDEATNNLIETLQQQRLSLLLTTAEPGRIIGEAEEPRSPSTPGLMVSLAGGVVGGLVLGIAAALLRERTDTHVRSADRLSRVTGDAPVISSDSEDRLWVSLAAHIAEISESSKDVRRVLFKAVGVTGTVNLTTHLEKALAAEFGTAGADTDPWRIGTVPSSESSDAPAPNSADDEENLPRVIDGSTGVSARSFARLAMHADVIVIVVPAEARLSEVEVVLESLNGIDTTVLVGLDRTSMRHEQNR